MPGGKGNIVSEDRTKGFDTHPEHINRTGLNRGFKGLTATLREVMDSDGYMIIENIIELDDNKEETGNIIKFGKVKIPKGEAIIIAAARKAAKGDMRAIEYITDRLEGKAIQHIEADIGVKPIEYVNVSKQFLDD